MLELEDVDTAYEGSQVLFDISLSVDDDEIVALVGRNGSGKTTTLRSIMGLTPPISGRITFDGERIDGLPPEEIFHLGIGHVEEDRELFPQLTVRENLLVPAKRGSEGAFETVYGFFPRLREREQQRAGTLSGGEQQMLAIAQVLIADPQLLLIDEPTEGLMPTLVEAFAEILRRLNEDGRSILLVEQNVTLAAELADRVYVMSKGEIQYSGTGSELLENRAVMEKYLTV